MEHIHSHLVAPSGPAANRYIGCDCCELILSQYCKIILRRHFGCQFDVYAMKTRFRPAVSSQPCCTSHCNPANVCWVESYLFF